MQLGFRQGVRCRKNTLDIGIEAACASEIGFAISALQVTLPPACQDSVCLVLGYGYGKDLLPPTVIKQDNYYWFSLIMERWTHRTKECFAAPAQSLCSNLNLVPEIPMS